MFGLRGDSVGYERPEGVEQVGLGQIIKGLECHDSVGAALPMENHSKFLRRVL